MRKLFSVAFAAFLLSGMLAGNALAKSYVNGIIWYLLLSGDSLDIIILRFRIMCVAMFCLLFLFILSFREKVLLYNPGWPKTHNLSASDF